MNQKKCPKCGEMNPAEAVMCWACYTPLTGGAAGAGAISGTAAPTALPAPTHDEGQKKAIPVWQMGVLGVAGLGGLAFLGMNMMGGTPTPEIDGGGTNSVPYDPSRGRTITQNNQNQQTTQVPSTGPNTTAPATGPISAPYTMVSAPNGNLEWGVAGIVLTQPTDSAARAAGVAAHARRTLKGWKAFHIYVFADNQAAQQFNEFQVPRRSDVLQPGDYTALAELWPRCVARYEYINGKESYLIPQRNPNGWWLDRSA